ncbi:putative WD-repeat protein [Hibiscus syriacus]|uniref:WD-repeat protein n=1 Tax=Hibiscus syriacus TaxID=106335 RepID=A0A6A2Y786_HIBSY|nr:putative WD-repeat protein [Hibiscus syriacus]
MAKTNIGSFFNKFLSLFILLLHLGCFVFNAAQKPTKKRKSLPLSPNSHKHRKPLSSTWTFLKRFFSSTSKANCKYAIQTHSATTPVLTSARNSQQSLVSMVIPPETHLSDSETAHQIQSGSCPESDISSECPFFPLRNDIFPCTACGEIFQKPHFLEQHQATKHAVSQLTDGDSGNNIVRIIFKTGWTDKVKNPEIHHILKIHNSSKILTRFEEYRELVKAKAARNGAIGRRDERCIADGNELLRFNCSTFMCDLGLNGSSSICTQQYCNACGIIKSGFSPKMDGISTLSTSWRAHMAIPEDVEEEFKFMNVKRAMLVCRVVAGRVGSEGEEIDKEAGGFDSVIGRGGNGAYAKLDDEELLVFNPRAVLPCFIIVYTV